jgi:hypothetical protein
MKISQIGQFVKTNPKQTQTNPISEPIYAAAFGDLLFYLKL